MKNKRLITGCAVGGIVLLSLALLLIWSAGIYNEIVIKNESTVNQWKQVENQYQKRVDMIPNIINIVESFKNLEPDALDKLTDAHSNLAANDQSSDILNDSRKFLHFQNLQTELSTSISGLILSVENHPEFKSNENFIQQYAQLLRTEHQISVERKKFNERVEEFNIFVKQFPVSMVAGMFKFSEKQYF